MNFTIILKSKMVISSLEFGPLSERILAGVQSELLHFVVSQKEIVNELLQHLVLGQYNKLGLYWPQNQILCLSILGKFT